MVVPRRAAMTGASPLTIAAVRTALMVLSTALAGVLAAIGLASLVAARRVVTPAGRVPDTRILDLDTAAQTITLTRTADTGLPGRYALFTTGTSQYLKLGSVLAEDAGSVKRKLLTHVAPTARLGADAAFSGWYYDSADELQLPYTDVAVQTPLGPAPAWVFPAPDGGDVWVVQVHGRGTTRAECLRAVPLFHALGVTSLLVSYRNDGEAPASRTGTYTLGATEWRDVEAAIEYARSHGARRVLLMGWSMGGAVALQTALQSRHGDLIAGVVLESPVIDWRVVLDYQAKLAKLPQAVSDLAIGALGAEWATPLTRGAIPFDRLDVVARAAELQHPILILHSDDDGFVPSDASHALAQARPDLVDLRVFDTARHAKLWNYDQERWSSSIRDWVQAIGITDARAGADS
ncbi:alpha/beta hydrolase family protein [Microbacterium terricola]|uniref:Alpha/beta hydrolase n=1 Tax=Microbacterium terricola TaxID=344163 RepID=A0ABM8DYL3_9MICO|nr:lysophospholipase [Microbacterium terricola]UYK38676.1 lysophospholipase [Microbacterium terricola]BDV30636.1 alpha/beta hydrolase [Microbacterium terricola]